MELDKVTQIAFLIASVLSFILTVILCGQVKQKRVPWFFTGANAVHTLWLLSIGLSSSLNLTEAHFLIFDAVHYCVWVMAISSTIYFFCKNSLPLNYRIALGVFSCSFLLFDCLLLFWPVEWVSIKALTIVQGILFSIVALLNVEQLYRNVLTVRLIKLFSLNLALVFIYDVYFFSQSLVKPELNPAFFQLRAVFSVVASVFMGVMAMTLQQGHTPPSRLSLSRPVVFYTASLTIAGSLMSVIALGGYYVGNLGGEWGFVVYALILLIALMTLVTVFASSDIKERLRVLVNKHLFSHKYDYREEWLKLIKKLSQPTSSEDVHRHAIESVASIFNSDGGALWLRRDKVLVPVYQLRLKVNIQQALEPNDSAFVHALEFSEWVFFPSSNDTETSLTQNNEFLPEWVRDLDDVWLILPLLNESSLTGFMALTRPRGDGALDWEDLDLLKTVGKQVASYLERHEQVEQLAEARQFEAFNKLSAYVMHDLKNLIAQQALVVKNAEKHKDNPAFIEDAISTINNSVTRMNHLLRKLQRNEAEGVSVLQLHEVLLESIRRCQKNLPHPTLINDWESVQIKADFESLTMVFVHVIRNAQDATPKTGFIDIKVNRKLGEVSISFEDNGEGMAPEFIRDRLFKPFETTKSGTGMGIGVHQVRDYIQALGGFVSVESALGEGTTFSITIPTVGVDSGGIEAKVENF